MSDARSTIVISKNPVEPRPFGLHSLFTRMAQLENATDRHEHYYLTYSNKLFVWFTTHAHILKSNVPEHAKYAHILFYDEVDLAMAVLGTECFPDTRKGDVDTTIRLTVDQYNKTVSVLSGMGVPVEKCANGTCFACHAYHALLTVRDIL